MSVHRVILVGLVGLFVSACSDESDLFPPVTTTSSGGGQGGAGQGGAGQGGAGQGGAGQGGAGQGGGIGGAGGSVSLLCGDGNVDYQSGEECDDGNTAAGDGCSAACAVEAAATCGNGALDLANDEECDDGNTAAGDGCSPACQLELVGQSCGDGQVQAPEVCDDGNTANGDGCNGTCNFTGTTSLFAGAPGTAGYVDAVGQAARFMGPGVLTVNATHLHLGEEGTRRIRAIDIATAAVTTIAGNGNQGYVDAPIGAMASFGSIEALASDNATLWAGDGFNHRIRAVSLTPPYAVTTVAGSGVQGHVDGNGMNAQLDGIRGLTYHNGFVYFLDPNAATLRRFDPATGDVLTLAGTPYTTGQSDGVGAAARFVSPRYMVSDGSGMLYIADTNGSKIRAFNTVTNEVTTFAGDGVCGYVDAVGTAARIHRPRGITSDGTSVYWTEFNAHTIRQAVVATGEVSTFAGALGNACLVDCSCPQPPPGGYQEGVGPVAQFRGPFSIVYHFPSRSLFVHDSGNSVIRRIQ